VFLCLGLRQTNDQVRSQTLALNMLYAAEWQWFLWHRMHVSKHDRRMTTIIHQKSCARSLPTLTCKTNADVLTTIGKMTTSSNILYYFERVPEVTIDQSQGSMVDWVKDVKKNNYWKSFIWCLLKSTKGPTKHPNLSPKPHPKTKTPSKTAILKENKTKSVVQLKPTANTRITTSMPTATSSPPQCRQQQAHHFRQDGTKSLHGNKQNTVIEIGLRLTFEKFGTTCSWKAESHGAWTDKKISITYKSKPRLNINCYLTQCPSVAIHTIKVNGGVNSCKPLSSLR